MHHDHLLAANLIALLRRRLGDLLGGGVAAHRDLRGEHEDEQGDEEHAKGRHMAHPPPLDMVARQLARAEQQRRHGLRQTPVQMGEAFHRLPHQMTDGAVVVVAALAADVAVAAVQPSVAVQAGGVGMRGLRGAVVGGFRRRSVHRGEFEDLVHLPLLARSETTSQRPNWRSVR